MKRAGYLSCIFGIVSGTVYLLLILLRVFDVIGIESEVLWWRLVAMANLIVLIQLAGVVIRHYRKLDKEEAKAKQSISTQDDIKKQTADSSQDKV